MAISYVGGASGTTSATLPSHQAGDLIIIWAYRDGSATPPTVPVGWQEVAPVSGTTNSGTLAYKFAVGSSETSGTWTNATSVVAVIYRGAAGIGGVAVTNGTGTSVDYPTLTMDNSGGTSWVGLYAGHRSTNTTLETPPTTFTNRVDVADATDEAVAHDSGAGLTGYTTDTVSVGGTSSNWCSVSAEILDGAANFNGGLAWKTSKFDDTSAWDKGGLTVTANTQTAPDGTTTADTIKAGAGSYTGMMRQYIGFASSTTYSLSCYVKKSNHRYVGLRIDNSLTGANEQYPFFDFDTGTLNTNSITGATLSVEKCANSWYRLVLTYTGATNASGLFDIAVVDSTGASGGTFAGTEEVYVWGARLINATDPEFITVSQASPTFTGQTVGILEIETIPVSSASLTFSGKTVGIIDNELVGNGTLTFTGQNVIPPPGRIAYSAGGSTYTTTTSSLDVATGSRTTGDVLLVSVMWRCSTPGSATITTSYTGFQWITPEIVQGGVVVRLGTVKWSASNNITFTLTNGGTVNAGYGNAVFFGPTLATNRWWTEYQVSKGAITGALTQGTVTGSALTASGVGPDEMFFGYLNIADNAFAWDTAPSGWTNASAQSSSVGEQWARQFAYAPPTSGTTSPSYSGTFTTTSTIPASGSVDYVLVMAGLSGSEVTVTETITVSPASLTFAGQAVAERENELVGSGTLTFTGQAVAPTDLADTIPITAASLTFTGQNVGIIDPSAPAATRAARGGSAGGPASPARIKAEEDYRKRKKAREKAIDASIEGFFDPKPELPSTAPGNGILGPSAGTTAPDAYTGPSFADLVAALDGPRPVPTWFPPFEPNFEQSEDDEEILLLL